MLYILCLFLKQYLLVEVIGEITIDYLTQFTPNAEGSDDKNDSFQKENCKLQFKN